MNGFKKLAYVKGAGALSTDTWAQGTGRMTPRVTAPAVMLVMRSMPFLTRASDVSAILAFR